MKKVFWLTFVFYTCFSGCNYSNDKEPFVKNKLNKAWLQKIIFDSDTSYSKPYFRSDFAEAFYYRNKKDSTLCQVMRDSSARVRQIIIEKNKVRTFYGQYYPNSQAMAIAPIGRNGRFEGEAMLFYPDGTIKSKGRYCDGFYCGEWQIYDEKGNLMKKEEYDSNGQMLRSVD